MTAKTKWRSGSAEKLRSHIYQLACVVVLCSASGVHATERGTLEIGISVGATRFGEFAPGQPNGYDYMVGQVRAGLFVERPFSLELGVRLELVDELRRSVTLNLPAGVESVSNAKLGLDLSFLYHLAVAGGGSSIYLGPIGSIDRPRIGGSSNEAQFSLGGLMGFKTLGWPVNPRLDLFWQRRFETHLGDGFEVYGARLGLSLFFSSSSPWDK